MTNVNSCSSMHPMRVVHGPSSASWSLDPSLLVHPSPLSIHHKLLNNWPSPSSIDHLATPTPLHSQTKGHVAQYTQHNTFKKKNRHNITCYIQLAISINKHMWTMNSTEKVWSLSTLASIIHHRTRPSHFLTSLSMRECPTRWQSRSWNPRLSKCHWRRQRPGEG